MSSSANTSRLIFKAFKSRGLSVSADASQALGSVLAREEDVHGSLEVILDEVNDRIQKQDVRSTIVGREMILAVVGDLTSSAEDMEHECAQLLDAFSSPKLCFDERQKAYKVVTNLKYQLLGDSESRAAMYRERLLFTQQRMLRSELFTMCSIKGSKGSSSTGSSNSSEVHEISTIDSLLGSTGVKVLFGMLTQPEEGVWYLEDLGSMVRLDLSQAQTYPVFFTEGSQVVVQGMMLNGTFLVQVMGLPPAEEREQSLKALDITDIFGNNYRPQQMLQLAGMEQEDTDKVLVILSDIHLDKQIVLEKIDAILSGFENNGVEPLYIFIGSFVSRPVNRVLGGRELFSEGFDNLADIIEKYPNQANNSKFLFVPGPVDIGSNVALPRRPISMELAKKLAQKVKHLSFASNPCRLRFYTQEIVFFREDLLRKMQRYLAVPLTLPGGDDGKNVDAPDITEQLVESLIDQAHLCPLPLRARPVHWELDHALRLFPLPHLLILADHTEHFSHCYKDCQAVNPGSFSSDFSFIVYQPATREVQFSKVPA